MPDQDVQYEPTTGVRLTPQYGDPNGLPTEGMTLPERYARAKAMQAYGLMLAPGAVAAGQVPTYAIDPGGEAHTSPQLMDIANALAIAARTPGRGVTTSGAVPMPTTALQRQLPEAMMRKAAPPPPGGTQPDSIGSLLGHLAANYQGT